MKKLATALAIVALSVSLAACGSSSSSSSTSQSAASVGMGTNTMTTAQMSGSNTVQTAVAERYRSPPRRSWRAKAAFFEADPLV